MRALRDATVPLPTILALECIWLATTWTRADGWLIALGGLLLVASASVRTPVTRHDSVVLLSVAVTQLAVTTAFYSVLHLFTLTRLAAAVGGLLIVGTWFLIRYNRVAWVAPLILLHAVAITWLALVAEPYPIDAYLVHKEAGRLLASGADPYADLAVMDNSGSYYINGYPYTPLTLLTYGGLAAVGGDPRWVGATALVAIVGILAYRARRNLIGLWILVMASIAQGNAMMIVFTFSEVFVAALIVASFVLFQNHGNPFTALLYGASFGGKQHLGLAVPAAATAWLRRGRRWSNAAMIGIGGLLAWGTGFLLSPNGYWRATVVNLAELDPNLEAASLFGITNGTIEVPFAVVVALSVIVGLLFSAKDPDRPLRAIAGSVATFLFLGPATHWTHWTLVGWLLSADLIFSMDPIADGDEATISVDLDPSPTM